MDNMKSELDYIKNTLVKNFHISAEITFQKFLKPKET